MPVPLFNVFYHHVLQTPEDAYISIDKTTYSYAAAYAVVSHVVEKIKRALAHTSGAVAISFRRPDKMLFAYWACLALDVDIVLLPTGQSKVAKNEEPLLAFTLSDSGGWGDVRDIDIDLNANPVRLTPKPDHPHRAIFFFTSGTTGAPKFIRTTRYQMAQALACLAEQKLMPYTRKANVFITPPLFHSYGISAVMEYTLGGSHLFFPRDHESIAAIQSLFNKRINESITVIEGVPYFYKQLALFLTRLALPALKHLGMGGDAVSNELLQTLHQKFNTATFSIRYGVTEIPSVIALQYFKQPDARSLHCLGKVLPLYTIHLRDAHGCPPHEEGEMCVTFTDVDGTGQVVYTQDIIQRAQDQWRFIGRHNFIKYRGYKINPLEIEASLNTHEQIQESRISLEGDTLVACVVPVGQEIDVPAIRSFLATRFPPTAIPGKWMTVAELERTATGKIKR